MNNPNYDPNPDDDVVFHHIPERNMWLAVIERAMIDYALESNGRACYRKGKMYRWLYYDKPIKYNLVWICDLLFDDDAIQKAQLIRKQAELLKQKAADGVKIGKTVLKINMHRV